MSSMNGSELTPVEFRLSAYPRFTYNPDQLGILMVQALQVAGSEPVYHARDEAVVRKHHTSLPLRVAANIAGYLRDHRSDERRPYIHPEEANCFGFGAAAAGWIATDELDFNLRGAGGLRVEEGEVELVDAPESLVAGQVYGIVRGEKIRGSGILRHLIVGLSEHDRHLGVYGHGGEVYIGSTVELMRRYEGVHLYHIPNKPRVVGTDDWQARALEWQGPKYLRHLIKNGAQREQQRLAMAATAIAS